MKHLKSILLKITAVLLTLPASAHVLYEQNFESVSDPAAAGWTYGGESMTIESDANGKFIRFSQGLNNGRSAQLTWGQDIFFKNGTSVLRDGCYRICYDFSIAKGSNNQYNSEFTVFTNHQPIKNQSYRTPWEPYGYWQNYLFDMSQVPDESYGFAIDGATIENSGDEEGPGSEEGPAYEEGPGGYSIDYSDYDTLDQGKWYTVTLDVDVNARTVRYSVASLEGEMIKSGIRNVPLTGIDGDQISMYAEGLFIMLARYQTIYDIDNIKIEMDGNPVLVAGDDFEYEGVWYTVLDPVAKTCKTKDGVKTTEGNIFEEIDEFLPGNIKEGELIIPSSVSDGSSIYTVVRIGYAGFANNLGLTSVKIPEDVYLLDGGSFIGCKNLRTVDLPASVNEIGGCAFYACESLAEIQLPSSLAILKNGVFSECISLKSIKIPDTIETIEKKTFRDCSALETVILPAALTEINEDAFLHCSSLTQIDFPEGLNSIGDYAFQGCTSLNEIVLPVSLSYLGKYAFSKCPNLKYIDIPQSISSLGEAVFWQCTSLESVELPTTLSSIGDYAFEECTNLTEIVLPAQLSSLGKYAFAKCTNLNNINIPQSISSLEEGLFWQCTSLESVELPSTLSSIGDGAFEECTNLTEIVLPAQLSSLGTYAFAKCTNLKNINIPQSILSLGEAAFWQCSSLETVNLPNSLRSIGSAAFLECTNLTEINWPQSLEEIQKQGFLGCTSIESVEFPESLNSIGESAFSDCVRLKTLSLPSSLRELGDNAFQGCDNIEDIYYSASYPREASSNVFSDVTYYFADLIMPNAYLYEIVRTIPWSLFEYVIAQDGNLGFANEGDDFEYDGIRYTVISSDDKTCKTKAGDANGDIAIPGNSVVGDIVIPEQVSDGYNSFTVIGVGHDGFINNTELTSIRLPETLTYIGDSSFSGCTGLTSFNFPNSLTDLGAYSFQNCTGFTTMEIPATVTSIGAGLFADCSNLTSVSLPNSITSIGLNTFARCTSLTEFEIPSSVTSIGTGAFINCTSLSTMTIPGSVEIIGISSFANCGGLASISIPSSVTSIGIRAFSDCAGLSAVYLPASLAFLGDGAFAGCNAIMTVSYLAASPITAASDVFSNSVYNNATLDMPNASVGDIRSTIPWSLFGHATAADGTIGFVTGGDDFEYEGIWYTVLDPDAKTAKTKDRGNHTAGNVEVPAQVSDGENDYSVIEIGNGSFQGSDKLLSINLPVTILSIGNNAFSGCPSLTSLVWNSHTKLSDRVVEEIGNPNLLLYVDSLRFAPDGMTANVVADGVCDNLVLTPGHAFTPVYEFTSLHSSMVKDFRQKTIIGRAAGWETIVLPFDATEVYAENLESYMTPFAALTEIYSQRPYWLYKADADEGWTEASAIEAGIPYIISMPNNTAYVSGYNVDGPVVFSTPQPHRISSTVTAPYAVTWASGREFRSLWLPLTEAEALDAMGLNVGLSNLTDDEGQPLAPGSAFHADVVPQPLEAYVTRLGAERAMRIIGNQSAVIPVLSDNGLDIRVEDGVVYARSDTDRTIHIYNPEGVAVRTVALKSGTTVAIDGLTPGIYLSVGRKLIVR